MNDMNEIAVCKTAKQEKLTDVEILNHNHVYHVCHRDGALNHSATPPPHSTG